MAKDDRAVATVNGDGPKPVRQIAGDVITVYESILDTVPDAGGDGIEGILEQIAAAQDVTGLDDPWRAGGLAKYVDVPIVIQRIRKMPSDFDSGLAYFLVVDGGVRATGEKLTVTTGSMSVVAQLLKAHQLGALPVVAIPRVSKRATAEGYYPQHLEFPQP